MLTLFVNNIDMFVGLMLSAVLCATTNSAKCGLTRATHVFATFSNYVDVLDRLVLAAEFSTAPWGAV